MAIEKEAARTASFSEEEDFYSKMDYCLCLWYYLTTEASSCP
ncbi:MAG: hypothetical protein PUB52_07930 [Lachnospiraceae bacterium]|nr:hypothetical protein [Lachnospiraceae bacterium]